MKRAELLAYLDELLTPKRFRDYAPNGLQVEGKAEVARVMTAVTASQAAIAAATAWKADALLVHHGYFWKGEAAEVVGMKRRRLAALLAHELNLIAYHLPLDQHPQLGNNALLGALLGGMQIWQSQAEPLIWHATVPPIALEDLVAQLAQGLPSETLHVVRAEAAPSVTHLAWCTGAAQDFLTQAAREGAEVYISGEYAERSYHEARENGCHFIACGHHASERLGVRALGAHLAAQCGLTVEFFDEPNPF